MATEVELDRLRNALVRDSSGARLGKVCEIFLNDRTQKISFVTVALGPFGTREVYIPYEYIDLDNGVPKTALRREILEGAPRANGLGHLTFTQEEQLRTYYESAVIADPCSSPHD
ncbi:PRC-barrel domain-containing protein [Dermabacter sp. p3-SID358]|uniref:PRC-barrel domain-containing protein n=1 Tax=Dermabacter sp. p3-SID358 TaxID=2916114 RepID=UPI0021A7BD97|nr:PRC-barrel domain-containing protein [Dermabacter sp. p3-SID358]MCT1867149.1 PRC-barrel domain-containing protein [Dermabacter sp. p3-SID358]